MLFRSGVALSFDSLTSLRKALYAAHPHFVVLSAIAAGSPSSIEALAALDAGASKEPFHAAIKDYHLTNAIARASRVMGECASIARRPVAVAAE